MIFRSFIRPFLEERERWFLWLPLFIASGIGVYFTLDTEPTPLTLALSPFLALLAIFMRDNLSLRPVLAALLAFALGFNAAQLETKIVKAPLLDTKTGPVSLTGRLMHTEILPNKMARLTIKDLSLRHFDANQTPRYVRIKVKTTLDALPQAGTRINIWGPLWPPAEPVAPHAYNFRRNSFFKQLGGSGFSYGQPRVRTSEPPPFFWDGFYLFFESARQTLIQTSYKNLTGPEAAMTATLLSGSQSSIDSEVMKAMRASGLSHLLSISGIHVSMFALLVYVPLRFLLALIPFLALRFSIKKLAALAAIISTSLYVLLVGPETPTVRSALMTAIVLFAVITDRKTMSMRLVALASMPIMLLAPSAVIGPSFQMSFAAVLAMVAAYEKRIDTVIKEGATFELPTWLCGIWKNGRDIILTSLIATAATTPFALLHFQTFSFYGVVANIIAIPLTSFWIMPNLLLTYLAMPLGLESLFIKAAGWGVATIITLAQKIAAWPLACINMPAMPFLAFFLFLGGGFWLCLWQKRWRYLGLIPLFLACLYPFFVASPSVFIAEEKGDWAVRLKNGNLAAYGKNKIDFTLSQWKQLANAQQVQFIGKSDTLGNEVICKKDHCLYKLGPFTVVFLIKETSPQTIKKLCATHEIIIAPFVLPACTAQHIIDADTLYKRGGHTLSINKGILQIQTVRKKRGQRPWSLGWRE